MLLMPRIIYFHQAQWPVFVNNFKPVILTIIIDIAYGMAVIEVLSFSFIYVYIPRHNV